MDINKTALALAERTRDAYSVDRYVSWSACAEMILLLGYSEDEAEAILRSKWMRWAADQADSLPASSDDLARWLTNPRNRATREEARRMM